MDGLLDTVARALIASPFLVSALDKTLRPEAARAEISAMAGRAGFAVRAGSALVAVLGVQWIGGICVLVPASASYGAALLIAFLVPVTFAVHAFWTFPAEERAMKRDHFFGNVAILGGLVLVMARVL